MAHQGAVLAVEIGAPVRCGRHVFLHRGGIGIAGVHLAFKALEFFQGQITGTAAYVTEVVLAVAQRHRRAAAFAGQIGGQDVGGGVQVALGMAANQFLVPGESDIAFQNTGAHASRGPIGFLGMFREL